jgi:hypothetical protein
MKRLQLLLAAVGIAIVGLIFVQPAKATIQSQQAQIFIDVVVQVVGTPIAYVPHQAPAVGNVPVIASLALRRLTPQLQRTFRAENLHFDGETSTVVAQAQNPLLVQAEVSPNPKATILVSNVPTVTVTAAPGQTVAIAPTCALTVTVNMSSAWSLQEGVSNDFSATFPGKDLGNNTYINSDTPQPTSTPYIVYADDGDVWSAVGSGGSITTYCVNLTVSVPAGVTDGIYSTNAVYTLYN